MRDPDRVARPEPEVLRTLYGLTRAEAVVAADLAAGLTLEEIAAKANVGIETVRTHVKRAMAKTDTRRQAELVLLVLRSAGFAGDGAG